MLTDKVVVDASPLIVLLKAGLEIVLNRCFIDVRVPEAVWTEVLAGGLGDPAASTLADASWARREPGHIVETIGSWDLGRGEAEVLSYALRHPDYPAVVDDAQARRCARALGIRTMGTGGVIVLAKRNGVIASATDALGAVIAAGLWVSPQIIEQLRVRAGEG